VSHILAVDPGDARIGCAISDENRLIARPLIVLEHRSRELDAKAILELARDHNADVILVGVPYDSEGEIGPQARKSLRLIEALRSAGADDVRPWDESDSTLQAQKTSRSQEELDSHAAAVILQDFLNAQAD
jgi:putative Holliday junction resolvase